MKKETPPNRGSAGNDEPKSSKSWSWEPYAVSYSGWSFGPMSGEVTAFLMLSIMPVQALTAYLLSEASPETLLRLRFWFRLSTVLAAFLIAAFMLAYYWLLFTGGFGI